MYSIERVLFPLLTQRNRRFVQKFAKSLMKAGHILVSGVRWIIQRITGTERLDGGNHLGDFIAIRRLVVMEMDGEAAYRISLVATPALMSASDMISLARVGVPAKALRTKHRYLKRCGNATMTSFASLTDRSHSSIPRLSSPLLESQIGTVRKEKRGSYRLPVKLPAFPTLAQQSP